MAGLWEEAKYWLDRLSSHRVGVGSVSAVCPRAGGLSRRRRDEIIVVVVVVVVEQQYILYIILLLAEVTGGSASGLGNIVTLAHFDALAFVKYIRPKVGCWPTTNFATTVFA